MSQEATSATTEPQRPFRPPRRRLTTSMLTVIFLSGAAVGVGLTLLLEPVLSPRRPRSFEQVRDDLTDRIVEGVGLSDEQTEQVRGIVEDNLRAYGRLREEILPRMEQQGQTLYQQVAEVLTPEQVPKWEEQYAEMSSRWFRRWSTTQPTTAETQPR